jgi:hypothetical protein
MRYQVAVAAILAVFALPASIALAEQASSFRTPSDNIHCLFSLDNIPDDPDDAESVAEPDSVDCEISEMTNKSPLPPKPADCDLDYGDRFSLAVTGKAGVICAGDTIRNSEAPVLAYGESVTQKGITCDSAETGVTCRNEQGHGFFLSKAKQKLF